MSNMAVQMNYGEPSRGMPGGLYDRAEYEAVTRRNSAEDKAVLRIRCRAGRRAGKGHCASCNGRNC